ncbi:hypothetical protein DAPPUDRAFT_106924 [Daphnia pulex]|uniref:Uncharacterized protein n=1 Tax=Daphnia pulex TaxID=6669 RepID=E9GVE4_DAPPU|nr:hypothetical protein DAPPUDRAFT_106924 [Daphnia pulex]|eukprot:EFX76400.1 hypothetical protein DAPPUDRAFT_106924 [Daphnia pulex]
MAVCNQFINLLTLVFIGTLPSITCVGSAAVLMAPPASRTLANMTVTKVVTATQATTTTQSVEPSAGLQVPEESLGHEVRAGVWIIPVVRRLPAAVEAIESSLDDDGIRSSAEAIRSSDPHLFSALLSSLLSGWQFPTIAVVTVTRTVYTATSTATLFTSTSVHTLLSAASCLPADFVACPGSSDWEMEEEEEARPTPSSSTDDPDLPSTDVL